MSLFGNTSSSQRNVSPDAVSHQSPHRARKGQIRSTMMPPASHNTPRQGAKKKKGKIMQQSDSTNTPSVHVISQPDMDDVVHDNYSTVDYMGLRRLLLQEIVELHVGDFFNIVIPPSTPPRTSTERAKKELLDAFLSRVLTFIADSCIPHSKDVKKREKTKLAKELLYAQCGSIRHDGRMYIVLRCSVTAFPNRDEYILGAYTKDEVTKLVDAGGGISLRLLDFPHSVGGVSRAQSTPILKWQEVSSLQLYVELFQGDARPKINFSRNADTLTLCHEFECHLEQVRGDVLQTTELLLAYERAKNAVLANELANARKEIHRQSSANHVDDMNYIQQYLDLETTNTSLQLFAHEVDNKYRQCWIDHYSGFSTFEKLVSGDIVDGILAEMEKRFKIHFTVLQSIVFRGRRAHQPSMMSRATYRDKQRNMLNHFLAMIRSRNPHLLVHWALLMTMAMYSRGVSENAIRSKTIKSYTVSLKVAFKYLDRIYNDTTPARVAVIRSILVGNHSLDNYQQYHPYGTQREGHAGIYHNGIVYNLVVGREYTKPFGTIIVDGAGCKWMVVASALINHWTCRVTIQQLSTDSQGQFVNPHETPSSIDVHLPNVQWTVESLPDLPPPVNITYLNQESPPSLRQRLPPGIAESSLIMGNREWLNDMTLCTSAVTPRRFLSLVCAANRLLELFGFMRRNCSDGSSIADSISPVAKIAFAKVGVLLEKNRRILPQTKLFRTDLLKQFNETYHATDKAILFDICPREELRTEEAMIAMVTIFESVGMIEQASDGQYTLVDSSPKRLLFQYGDVLTIKKWNDLAHHIIRKLTHIGKEDYVNMMMAVYKRFVKCYDYLHENIHRMQIIYKRYYGGFIQAVQALLKVKKVREDPTKGNWKQHEWIVLKMLWALESLRLEAFMSSSYFPAEWKEQFDDDVNAEEMLWLLQDHYNEYCLSLEKSRCEVTRSCVLFMKYVSQWRVCTSGIGIGDWASLEVLGNDWLLGWAAMKKPQYELECKRRIESLYNLKPQELEYHRVGRFARMYSGGRCMSWDDVCEKHNWMQKRLKKNSDFNIVCNRSKHLHAAFRCGNDAFNRHARKHNVPNAVADCDALKVFFRKVKVFQNPANEERKLDRNTFWAEVTTISYPTEVRTSRFEGRKHVMMSDHEKVVLETFFDKESLSWMTRTSKTTDKDNDNADVSDSDSSNESNSTHTTVCSIATTEPDEENEHLFDVTDDDSIADIEVPASTEEGKTQRLKPLGNVRLCEMKIDWMISDLFEEGKVEAKDIAATRGIELEDMKEMLRAIYDSVKCFKDRMKRNEIQLENIINGETEEEIMQPWQIQARAMRGKSNNELN